jgi:hypothetical protein
LYFLKIVGIKKKKNFFFELPGTLHVSAAGAAAAAAFFFLINFI